MPNKRLYKEGLQKFKQKVDEHKRVKTSKEIQVYNEVLSGRTTAQEIQRGCINLRADAGKKFDDEKVHIPDAWVSNIFDNIGTFIKIGDTVMTKAPKSVATACLIGSGLTDQAEIMVTIFHYDHLYDERNKPGYKENELLRQMFDDISDMYAAMLDFSFSIKRHISGGFWAKVRNGAKDLVGVEAAKFQAKVETTAALKDKVVKKSQGVFQSKTSQRFDEVQDMVSAIMTSVQAIQTFQSTTQEFYQAELLQQQDILQALNEIKALLGICNWILEVEEYKDWRSASSGERLCITGPGGVGNSTVLASTWANVNESVDQDEYVVLYLSCDMDVSGESGKDSPQSLARISNTLISKLYEMPVKHDNDPVILENCNNVFKNQKERGNSAEMKSQQIDATEGKFSARMMAKKKNVERLPDIAEGLSRLASILNRKVFIILDAVDRMTDEDQKEIYSNFEESVNDSECEIHTLLGRRSGTKLFERIRKSGNRIDVEGHNELDIKLVLDTELGQFHQWKSSQIQEAKDKIGDKAGTIFKYVIRVALSFIKEPFQGSLPQRLDELPEGIGETYNQALRAMSSNYLDLLRTALSFALFSPQPVNARVIIDSFTDIYLETATEEQLEAAKRETDLSSQTVSRLQSQQLHSAAGPFLDIYEDDSGNHLVDLNDASQVQQYFFHSTSNTLDHAPDSDKICALCKSKLSSSKALTFSEQERHRILAITCIKHMCSPLFQSRYLAVAAEATSDDSVVMKMATRKHEAETDESNDTDSHEDSDEGEDKDDDEQVHQNEKTTPNGMPPPNGTDQVKKVATLDNKATYPTKVITDFKTKKIWMTRNGERIEAQFSEEVKGRLFPILGLVNPVQLDTNLGDQPFNSTNAQAVIEPGESLTLE